MGRYDFDRVVEREGTNCLKYDLKTTFMPQAPEDALPLWVADMDFACCNKIVNKLHERVDREIYGYTSHKTDDYYDAVCGWFSRRFGWDINRDSLFISPGVVPALSFLINILVEEGEGIIIQKPVYYPFEAKIQNNNRKVVNSPLKYIDGKYEMDYDGFEALARDKNNKLFILCSPHNPVGRVWKEEELRKIVDICKKHDLWIISDEIHCDIIRANQKHTPLEVACDYYKDRIITCTAPSKSFNLAGMQISNIIINNEEIRAKWLDITDSKFSIGLPNPFSLEATKTAYNECEDWIDEVNAYIDENIRYISDFVNEHLPKVKMVMPEGTYLLWLDFREYGLDSKELENVMLHEAGVLLDEGYIFGEEGIGFERINVASPRSIIEDCMNRIKVGFEGK